MTDGPNYTVLFFSLDMLKNVVQNKAQMILTMISLTSSDIGIENSSHSQLDSEVIQS